jgi:MoaA/NifB/PqqE/SkfB family radical SAM enzyme
MDNLDFHGYVKSHHALMGLLIIQVTLLCPLKCEHCNVNAGPDKGSNLDVNNLLTQLGDFANITPEGTVFITGGEPFSAKLVLDEILKLCETLNLSTYIITSANWARTLPKALKTLKKYSKIHLLSVSADQWHEDFVPIDYVENAVRAALSLGINVNVALTLTDEFDDYESSLKSRLLDVWDTLHIERTLLRKVGRSQFGAKKNTTNMLDGYCGRIGAPTITSDGSIIACCSTTETNIISQTSLHKNHALKIGHISRTSMSSIKDTLEKDILLKAIRLLGPSWVYKQIHKDVIVTTADSFRDICDICATIVRNPEVADFARNILNQSPNKDILQLLDCTPCPTHSETKLG